jgi:V/A-type H+/Na+-transporting ATPase subunit E
VTTTVDGNIETLSRAILGEAQAEIEDVRSAAQSRAEAILNRARASAEQQRSEILDRARQEAKRLKGQATATAQLRARTQELEHREQLLQRVFDTVEERLGVVKTQKDFAEAVKCFLREALDQLRTSPILIKADPASRSVLTRSVLDQISRDSGIDLEMGEALEKGIGVVVQSSDGRLQFDNTLENRLGRMQGALRAEVYRVLTGEMS